MGFMIIIVVMDTHHNLLTAPGRLASKYLLAYTHANKWLDLCMAKCTLDSTHHFDFYGHL